MTDILILPLDAPIKYIDLWMVYTPQQYGYKLFSIELLKDVYAIESLNIHQTERVLKVGDEADAAFYFEDFLFSRLTLAEDECIVGVHSATRRVEPAVHYDLRFKIAQRPQSDTDYLLL